MTQNSEPNATVTLTASIRTAFERRTLIVGDREAVVENFPTLADQILACEKVELCGELDGEHPVDDLWKRIEQTKAEQLWIIGGDGTINMVGECMLQHQASLPCLLTPGGTANDLARAITEHQIATTASNSADLDAEQPSLLLDLLEVRLDNSARLKCCANMFTLGSSARNTQHVTEEIKERWGAFAYLSQIWRALGDLTPFSIRMRVGSGDTRTVAGVLNLFIANGPFCGGGHRLAPPAIINDGLLDTVIFRTGTTTALAAVVAKFVAGAHLEDELVEHFSSTELSMECDQPSPLTLDGEAFTAQSITVRSRPAYLPITLIPKQ